MTEPKTQTEAASTKCPCPGGRCGHPVTSHKFFINDDHVGVNVCRECDVEKFEGDTERFKFYTYHEVESITLAATRGLREQLEAAEIVIKHYGHRDYWIEVDTPAETPGRRFYLVADLTSDLNGYDLAQEYLKKHGGE